MKKRWRQSRPRLLAKIGFLLARGIGRTLRWEVRGAENLQGLPGGAILNVWHGRSFIPANYFRNRGIWALFSLSNDGELQSRIFSQLGFRVIRGSTGRGGERAAIEAIRVLRQGDWLALTPDGPRGPSHVAQGGVLLMAKKSGAAMVPLGTSARPRWLANAWDRYLIPRPFGRALLVIGAPIWISKDASEEEVAEAGRRLTLALNRLENEAERHFGFPGDLPETAAESSEVHS